jgi:hypothetical protein
MPKASEIATELRRIADVLDKQPETEAIKPNLHFYHGYDSTKAQFLNLAAIFPRPYKKGDGWDHKQITLTHETAAVNITASIERDKVCMLKEPARPAVYDCEPLLSQEEEATLTV